MARPANPRLAQDILTVTMRVLEEGGPEAVTMREVASRLGYTPTTLYLYYADKTALLDQVVARALQDMEAYIDLSQAGLPVKDALRERARAYVRWGVGNSGIYRLAFESRRPVLSEGIIGSDLVGRAVAEGVWPRVNDVAAATLAYWAGAHGVTSLAISGLLGENAGDRSAEAATRAIDTSVDAWFDAWGERRRRRAPDDRPAGGVERRRK